MSKPVAQLAGNSRGLRITRIESAVIREIGSYFSPPHPAIAC